MVLEVSGCPEIASKMVGPGRAAKMRLPQKKDDMTTVSLQTARLTPFTCVYEIVNPDIFNVMSICYLLPILYIAQGPVDIDILFGTA